LDFEVFWNAQQMADIDCILGASWSVKSWPNNAINIDLSSVWEYHLNGDKTYPNFVVSTVRSVSLTSAGCESSNLPGITPYLIPRYCSTVTPCESTWTPVNVVLSWP